MFLSRWSGAGKSSRHPDETALPADGVLAALRTAALAATGVLITVSTMVAFAESYRGLYQWSTEHGLSGFWACVWPLQVDSFVAVGELTLFAATVSRWPGRARVMPWAVTIAGLAVSVAGNVGHVSGHSFASHATAAVPPVAASAAMAVGLAALKRVVHARTAPASTVPASAVVPAQAAAATAPALGPAAVVPGAAGGRAASPGNPPARAKGPTAADVARHFAADIAAGRMPSQRAIRMQWKVGSDRARELVAEVERTTAPQPGAPGLFSEEALAGAR